VAVGGTSVAVGGARVFVGGGAVWVGIAAMEGAGDGVGAAVGAGAPQPTSKMAKAHARAVLLVRDDIVSLPQLRARSVQYE
jgi:hypothetical protein